MSTTLIVTLLGILMIAVFGFIGRRRPTADMSEWTVGGRNLGASLTWFLQAGEVFTTFTFLGLAGLAYTSGAPAFYALGYIPLQYGILYLVAPRIWKIGKDRGYLTQSDFLAGQYKSKTLGFIAAVLGVAFLLPYLQLQITGLGLIVQVVTGDKTSGTLSMVVGCVLMVAFVLWAGIHGVATASYFKDAIMVIMLVVVAVVAGAHFSGGFFHIFDKVAASASTVLTLHAGKTDQVWFISNMAVSILGAGFAAFPYIWPGILGARSDRILRRNYLYQPIYAVCVIAPIALGFLAIVVLPKGTSSNSSLLILAGQALPDWAMGLLAVAGVATAMVPGGALLISLSSLVARNIIPLASGRKQFWLNQGAVVVIAVLALLIAVGRPDALANLALLTFSGLTQLVPAIVSGLRKEQPLWSAPSVIIGLLVGGVVVAVMTFANINLANISVGLIGLVANVAVTVACDAVLRRSGPAARPAGAAGATMEKVSTND